MVYAGVIHILCSRIRAFIYGLDYTISFPLDTGPIFVQFVEENVCVRAHEREQHISGIERRFLRVENREQASI